MKIGIAFFVAGLSFTGGSAYAGVTDLPSSSVANYQYYPLDGSLNGGSFHKELSSYPSSKLVSSNGTKSSEKPYVYAVSNPSGIVSTSSNLSSIEGWYATSSASIGYQIKVVGDNSYNYLIPVDYTAYLSVSTIGDSSHNGAVAEAEFSVGTYFTKSYRAAFCTSGCVGDQPSSIRVQDSISIRVNGIISVGVGALTEAINLGAATAYADPYFYIDPDFLISHPGFSLQISPGIGNDPTPVFGAVPEPSSWVMLLTGFGLVGLASRRATRLIGPRLPAVPR